MAFGATVLDIRQSNRARVLRHIVLTGETSRPELSTVCRLSTGTITNVVSELIADGLVHEVGSVPSRGGRPINRLAVRPEGAYFVGAGVGEHSVRVELFDLAMNTVDHEIVQLPAAIAEIGEVGQALTRAIHAVRERQEGTAGALAGIGLGVPGLVDASGGRVTLHADHLGWRATDLADFCRVGDLPVYAENGAKALTTAERWFGALRGVDHAVVALIGRGVGVGVVSDGRLLRGLRSSAGEWGHTTIVVGGRKCVCGDRGCVEAYVGGEGILARWREQSGRRMRSGVEAGMTRLLAAAAAGDDAAVAVLDETVEHLGIALANLVNLLNPEKVVIGGWAGLNLQSVRGTQLAEAIRRHSLPRPARDLTVEPCVLGVEAVSLGAALLPLEQLIDGVSPAGMVTA
jgi:predicted NBD/HSP70 family sugar kinase